MMDYSYDLHIHSCLSPCADDDMTPANIAGMAVINGLKIVALTDHNSCKNCPAFFKACKQYGIIPVPGMELTTMEDIHLICLFPGLEEAMAFDAAVSAKRMRVPNDKRIFGNQWIMDEEDRVVGEEADLLIVATTLSLEEGHALALAHGGAAYPAHIDREAGGLLAILGAMPEEPQFPFVEFRDARNAPCYAEKFGLQGKENIYSSDAHNLWNINEADHFLAIEDVPYSSALVRRNLMQLLRKGEE